MSRKPASMTRTLCPSCM
ncbi:hypothetical protein Gorai_012970 [Gossypium raimondii]|uniref:Uncharacterized protein n=1 Tax=Gossypium raimondii TaxID=29730 RepID=A0A7J8Q3W3_GOSRA|nr:hypothetical protein [Gossypium raimondii]